MVAKDKKRRLFFALWPSAQVREAIVSISAPVLNNSVLNNPVLNNIRGRTILPKNLHITLHFIGAVNDDKKDCLHKAAQSIIAHPFNLCLDGFGHFSKAKIFWMSAQEFPQELSQLHQNLGKALSVCDYQCDQRPYSPHVSLLRKAERNCTDYPEFSINWHVDEFVLLESSTDVDGVSYKVIETYPLHGQ